MLDQQARIGAGLLVVIGAAVLATRFLEPAEETDEDGVDVWSVVPDEVQRLEVDRPEDPFIVERRDGGWWLLLDEGPVRADAFRVESALDELERAERGQAMPDDADIAAFGLVEPSMVVRVTDQRGDTQALEVGNEAPVGWTWYVRGQSGQAVAVEARLDKLGATRVSFRDLRPLRYPPSEVVKVSMSSDEGELVVSERDGTWWVEGYGRASLDAVDDLVVGLLDVRLDVLLGDTGPIDDAWRSARIELEDGTIHGVDVARETVPGGRRMRAMDGMTGVIRDGALALLGQGPVDVVDPIAFPLGAEALQSVTVRDRGTGWTLTREGGAWHRDGQAEGRANEVLNRLEKLSVALQREPLPPFVDETGEVVAVTAAGSLRYLLGPVDGDYRSVRDARGGPAYRVDASEIESVSSFFDSP